MSWYTNPTAQLEKTKIVAYALRTQLPQYSPSPKSICVLLEGESPVLTRYVEFDQILKRNPHIKLHSTIFAGNANCMEKKAVDATVSFI